MINKEYMILMDGVEISWYSSNEKGLALEDLIQFIITQPFSTIELVHVKRGK